MVNIFGSGGNDTITDTVNSAGGLLATNDSDFIVGDSGPDPFGSDFIFAAGGNDFIDGAVGDDTLLGGDGDDDIAGSNGNDSILGGAGNDIMEGNAGRDTYTGGTGADNFYLANDGGSSQVSAPDIVTDFSRAEGDRITLFDGQYSPVLGQVFNLAWGGAVAGAVASLNAGLALPGGVAADKVGVYWVARTGGDGWVVADLDRDGVLDSTDFAAFVDTSDNGALVATDFANTFPAVITGTAGADTITPDTISAGVTGGLPGGLADTIRGGAGNDSIDHGGGDDLVFGEAGNDVIRSTNDFGNDTLDGGADNDRVFVGGGNDSLVGGDGVDSLDFGIFPFFFAPGPSNSLTVDLAAGRLFKPGGDTDTIRGFEAVLGTVFATNIAGTMIGDGGDNTLVGFGADDSLVGGGGNDSLNGSLGNDTLLGGEGDDVLQGAGGSDLIIGGTGFDRGEFFNSTAGVSVNLATQRASDGFGGIDTVQDVEFVRATFLADTLIGTAADERFAGFGGGDTIDGAGGIDTIDFFGMSTGVSVSLATNRATSTSGTDSFSAIEVVFGSGFADTVIGNDGANTIFGGSGNDSIAGAGGSDLVGGESGNDTLLGGSGDDILQGGSGDDSIQGGSGNDIIDGGDGADVVSYDDIAAASPILATVAINAVGAAVLGNNATVSGAASGTDQLVTIEQINGTAGDDTFIVNSVNTDAFLFYIQGGAGNDSMAGPAGLNRGLLLDYLSPNVTSGVSVNLGTGRAADGLGGIDSFTDFNAVRGSALADTLIGGAANDRFRGRGGNDSIDGGDGFDLADYSQTTGAVSVDLVAGRAQDGDGGTDTLTSIEQIRGSNFADTLIGSGIGEGFRGNAGGDTIEGGGGNDTIDYGSATTGVSVNLFAGRASDGQGGTDSFSNVEYVLGGTFNDGLIGSGSILETLNGGAGDDVLSAFGGNDVMIGGSGFDVANYSGQSTGITASIVYNGTAGHSATIIGAFGTDTAFEIEAINGTTIGDRIVAVSADPSAGLQARGFAGNDTIVGTADRSLALQIDYRVTGVTAGVTVNLGTGEVLQDGFGGQDSLVNISFVRGTDFADSLVGSDLTDRFRGRGGSDFIDGGGGDFDIIDYSQSSAAVSVNLASERAQDGEGGTDTILGFEEVRASTNGDTLVGSGRAEAFQPFNGNDVIDGAGGQDRVIYGFTSGNVPPATTGVTVNLVTGIAQDGWGGTDTLIDIERVTGTAFADSILGGAESNRFRGQAGNDTLDGGLGGDFVEYNNATAGVTVNLTARTAADGQGGTDSLISIEHVIGSAFADRLNGVAQGARSVSDLRGGAGNDTLVGINGQYVRADYADQTMGLSINLAAGSANDGRGGTDTLINIRGLVMFGDHADTLLGSAFGEWFSPSLGADSVNAGGGLDILSYGGADTAGVSVNLALGRALDHGGNIDTVLGFEGVAGSFNADTIIGNGVGNLIGPAGGADSVNAGLGEDTVTYSLGFSPGGIERGINEAGDRLPVQGVTVDLITARATDYGGAIDTILGFEHAIGGTANDILRGTNLGNHLVGDEGNDTLEGRGGNDTLNGGLGVDRLVGGLDDDTYVIDTTADVIVEFAGGGIDTILASRAAVVMAAEVEVIVATNAIAHAFTGNALGNLMIGAAGNDTLAGGDGADTLDGGDGADRLLGGAGDDVYLVGAGDFVAEGVNAGIDTVVTALTTYALANNVEHLLGGFAAASLLTGNTLANLIVGGAGADTLVGGFGDDTLEGGLGADSLVGGAGNDFHLIGAGDIVVELNNQGIDTVSIDAGTSYNLAATVEVLIMTGDGLATANGSNFDNTILGGDAANLIQGFGGRDLLSGLGGNDILVGGAGQDTLLGGAGNDQFRFLSVADSAVATPDRIADFSFVAVNLDRIALNLIDADTTVALDQAFVYRGALAFTGTAGELRVESLGGGVYRATGDVNRDQVADFAIEIVSATGPVQNWFIL